MKAQMLKMAGVKTEAAFYKKFPTQEAFMKVHGKAFKKAQIGTYIGGDKAAPIKPINFKDMYDEADLSVTGKTNDIRNEEAYKQANIAAQQSKNKSDDDGGDILGQLGSMFMSAGSKSEGGFGEMLKGATDSFGEARNGKNINVAQNGNMFGNMFGNSGIWNPGNTNIPSNIGYTQNAIGTASSGMTGSGFQTPNYAQQWSQNSANSLPSGVKSTSVQQNIGYTPLQTGQSPYQQNQPSGLDAFTKKYGKYLGPVGGLMNAASAIKAEKKAAKQANQMRQVSDLALKASNTRPEQTQRRYVRPEDMITSGNQLSPTYGTGTNVLAQEGAKVSKNKQAETSIFDDVSNMAKDVWDTVSGEKSARENRERWKKKHAIDDVKERQSAVTLKQGPSKKYSSRSIDVTDLKNSKSLLNDPANVTSYRYNNPAANSFVDERRPGDVIDVKKYSQPWLTVPVSTVNDKEYQKLINKKITGKGLSDLEKGRLSHIDWYSNPETIKKFAKNTGLSGKRLKDFIARSLRYHVKEGDLDADVLGETRAEDNLITMKKQSDPWDVSHGIAKYWNRHPTMMHEYAHASELDSVLAPALYKALGKSTSPKINKGGYNPYIEDALYMEKPEEIYGNFHGFRNKLKFKPGEKTTPAKLKKRFEDWQNQNPGDVDNMIKAGYNFNQLSNAINTVAYNPNNDEDVTYAQDGAEIQNTYAPGTLYDDLGYEPLEDSTQVKQYQNGGAVPWDIVGQVGSDVANTFMDGGNGGGQAGSILGEQAGGLIGSAFGPGGQMIGKAAGKIIGTVAGNVIDPYQKAIKRDNAATQRNITNMGISNSIKGAIGQYSAFAKDGGYVSNDWNPQVIAKFGDHSAEDVYDFAHEGMKSFRAGGHLKSYTPPSERAMETYAMGGELQTHWGGHMEEMSENPYLPDGGVTYMPHGQSHDESDGKGRTGIGITYGDNPVEVERREPIMKLKDGSTGEDNLVVFGNLEIPKYGVELLGDKKAKGMKFKNYVSDLSKSETKQNKIIQKSADELDSLTPRTSFDKLKFAGLQANILGGNMKLKEIADTKQKAAALQNSINDTAEEFGLDADSLAKGKIKTAKMGGKFSKAQNGVDMDAGELNEVTIAPKKIDYMRKAIASLSPKGIVEPDLIPKGSIVPDSAGIPVNLYEPSDKSPKTPSKDYSWIEALNSIIPNLRPSDAEDLNANQLLGEMYALSQNQEEPVQAQLFSPQLATPYSISLQDQMNEITAQTRAAQRMAQGNPAAQAAIAAQAYEAINKVKGEEFRMNQALADKVYTGNIAAMNDAKLKNLGILDQQYTRQATAKSNTKAVAQAALNSISDKYAKNALENRTLKTYENMYNYRYDANGRLINMNPLQEWNTSGILEKGSTKDLPEGYEYIYNKKGQPIDIKKATKEKAKNGSIVKAMRNL